MQTFGGATQLMYACQQCKEHEVSSILLKNPSVVNERDRTLKTPLHYCAENATTKCAESILKIAPELVNAQDENGYCPLHLAVIAGNKNLIKVLISKGADINIFDNEGHSAIHWAIVSNEKEALEMTINAGANPSTPDIHGGYPLHYAVQMCGANNDSFKNSGNAIKVVQALLHYGVDVNVMDKDGRQPILWAASAGSAEAVIHLISGGARVDASDKDGLTALHCAASRGHTDTIETLITLCGGEVDIIDGNGCSPLFYAVTLGHADSTEILLKLGAEPNRQDRKGRTAAHCGAAKGQLETLRILQKHEGNLWIRNVKGDLPFHEAVASGRKDLVLWLLSQNPDAINIGNNDGRCALHIAAMYNNTEIIKILLDLKCLVNPVMRTSKGILMTPLNVALCKGHRSCGKFLQLHGGVPFSKVSKLNDTFVQAVRISPLHEGKNKINEEQSPVVSPSFRILPPQNDFEEAKTENGEKKKIYRRRKKKKNHSNDKKVINDESDSEGSFQETKSNATFQRSNLKSRDNTYESSGKNESLKNNNKNKNLTTTAHTNDSNFSKNNQNERMTTYFNSEESEKSIVAEKSEVLKNEPKISKENGYIKELKNVSNLSPDDFPPTMQSVTQLDSEIIEAEIETGKITIENEKMDDYSNIQVLEVANFKNNKELQGESTENDKNSEKILEGSSKSSYFILTSPNSPTENSSENYVEIKNDNESLNNANKETNDNSDIEISNKKVLEKKNDIFLKPVPLNKLNVGMTQKNENSAKLSQKEDCKIQTKENLEMNLKKNSPEKIDKKDVKANKIVSKKHNVEEPLIKDNQKKCTDNEGKINGKGNSIEESQSIPNETMFPSKNASRNTASEVEDSNSDQKTSEALNKSPEIATPTEIYEAPFNDSSTAKALGGENKADEINIKEIFLHCNLQTEKSLPETSVGAKPNLEVDEHVDVPLQKYEIPLISEIKKEAIIQEEVVNKQNIQSPSIAAKLELKNDKTEIESSEQRPEEKSFIPEIKDFANSSETKSMEPVEKKKNEKILEALEPQIFLDENISLKNDKEKILDEITINENDENMLIDKNILTNLNASNEVTLSDALENLTDASKRSVIDSSQIGDKFKENENETNKTNNHYQSSSNCDEDRCIQNGVAIGCNDCENLNDEIEEEKKLKKNEKSDLKSSRVTRLCRRNKDLRDTNQISVTQLVQGTIRKYHMERGIFHQLLELKRLQIRAGRANEQILVKRLVDEYERSRFYPGMKHFTGTYKFREFEKFLYDQLKAINKSHAMLPDLKSYDDIDALSGILKKSRFRILNDSLQQEPRCACITQRCHHTMYAYTTIPCSAYVASIRRSKISKKRRDSFLPRIDQSQLIEKEKFEGSHPTLELMQGNEKKVISLPQSFPEKGKKYYITFTIKSAQTFKEDDEFMEETKNFFKHRHANSV